MSLALLPANSRLKIFHASAPLNEEQSQLLLKEVSHFVQKWQSHKQKITASFEWKYQQFLFIGVDESEVCLSGCSIDSLSRLIDSLGRQFGVDFLNSPPICYRTETGQIHCVERFTFKKMVQDGKVHENTFVFNNLLESVGEYQAGKWEVPLKESWHARAFPIPA